MRLARGAPEVDADLWLRCVKQHQAERYYTESWHDSCAMCSHMRPPPLAVTCCFPPRRAPRPPPAPPLCWPSFIFRRCFLSFSTSTPPCLVGSNAAKLTKHTQQTRVSFSTPAGEGINGANQYLGGALLSSVSMPAASEWSSIAPPSSERKLRTAAMPPPAALALP